MNDKNKYIDRLFEDSLGQFAVEPGVDSWGKMSEKLDAISKQGIKSKYIRWISFSVAAVAILAYVIFFRSCTVGANNDTYTLKERLIVFNNTSKIKIPKNIPVRLINVKKSVEKQNVSKSKSLNIIDNQVYVKKIKIASKINSPSIASSKSDRKPIPLTDSLSKKINDIMGQESEDNTLIAVDNLISAADVSDLLTSDVIEYSEIDSTDNLMNQTITSPSVNAPMGTEIATGLELEFGLGLMVVSNNLPHAVSYDNPLIKSTPNTSFSTTEGYLQLKYKVSNFYGKSGFRFSALGENMTFNINTEMHDTSNGYQSWNLSRYWTYDTIGYYDDPNSPNLFYPILSPTYHIDTLGSQWNSRDITYYDETTIEVKNRYRYMEIPFLIGYQHNFNRLGLFADGGIGIGIMINNSGGYINEGQFVHINYATNPYKSLNLNYIINFGTSYSLTNHWNVFLLYNYKSNLTSIYKPQFDNGVKYKSIGIQLGMSYIIK